MSTRAAIYARQSVSEPEGIERQLTACRALATAREYEVAAEYIDDATSGYKARAEGTAFDRMLADARERRFDVLVVRKIDRLGRSLAALEALTRLRVQIVTVDGELDLSTPGGRLVANLITAVSRNESEVKAERRVAANAERRIKDGIPTSGRVPYGYRWVTTKERAERGSIEAYALDGDRADDVRHVFAEFLAGVPLGAICRDLNERGRRTLPMKRTQADGSRVEVPGAPFRPSTLRRMLLNPYYAALLPVPPEGGWVDGYDQLQAGEQVRPGAWPAIVSPEEWREARARLVHPERRTSPGPSRKWLLSGIARCGHEGCGELVRAGGGRPGVHSYRCRSMRHFARGGAAIDRYVERAAIMRLSEPEAVDLLEQRERPDVAALRAERERLTTKIREAGDDEQDGLIDRAERIRLTRRANAAVAKIDEQLRAGVDVDALGAVIGQADVAAAWAGLSLGRRRGIVEALFAVTIDSPGRGNRRNISDEAMSRTVRLERLR